MDQSHHRRRTVAAVPETCRHLSEFRSRYGAAALRELQECLSLRPPGRAAIRCDRNEVPRCGASGPAAAVRLYACVACAVVSCHAHAPSHAAAAGGHEIAVDVERAELFCCSCRDQVYDRDFDAAVIFSQPAASSLGSPPPLPENLR